MLKAIVKTWPADLAKRGHAIDPNNVDEWIERETKRIEFLHSKFPSQDIHGTPMGLVGDLNDDTDEGTDVRVNSHDANGLLYIYLWYPMGVAEKLVDLTRASGFKDRFTKIRKALEQFKEQFDGDEPILEAT